MEEVVDDNSVESNTRVNDNKKRIVSVQNVHKLSNEGTPILSNLSINVYQGTIYGLLGPSGCGKTNLLGCLVGLKTWNSGTISLFGKSVEDSVATKLGYMPQDIALYNEISIQETVQYYGRLYGMRKEHIDKQYKWIIEFLHLPSEFKLLRDCSGGMKRRVSLAVTLVHKPHLLLLDEPTVGMDPLLRENIWSYLRTITETNKTTVIITTHYVEEARCADRIGVMRKGRMLVECSPQSLLDRFNCNLLEDCVLLLCQQDSIKQSETTLNKNHVEKRAYETRTSIDPRNTSSNAIQRIRAMSTILSLLYIRNIVFFFAILFLPVIQMSLTLLVFGEDPKNLNFGVIDYDSYNWDSCSTSNYLYENLSHVKNAAELEQFPATSQCNFTHLSCIVIKHLSNSDTLRLTHIKSEEQARQEVHKGNLWGYFVFPSNYSTHFSDRVIENRFANNETLEGSQVSLHMDWSQYFASLMVMSHTLDGYQNFVSNLTMSCGVNPKQFQLPIKHRKPVFGDRELTFKDFAYPVCIPTVIFEIAVMFPAVIFINDRRQGTLERSQVAGLRFKEVICSYLLTQGAVIVGQTLLCYLVLQMFWDVHVLGSAFLLLLLVILGGIGGQALGFLMGIAFNREASALTVGCWIAIYTMSYNGSLNPIQFMTKPAQSFARFWMTPLLIESIRSVMYRGVGLFHATVWPGVLLVCLWTLVFWTAAFYIYVRKQKRA